MCDSNIIVIYEYKLLILRGSATNVLKITSTCNTNINKHFTDKFLKSIMIIAYVSLSVCRVITI